MTGETKDRVLEIVEFAQELQPAERMAFMGELLDHLCMRCGLELPKFGGCRACGMIRAGDLEGMQEDRFARMSKSDFAAQWVREHETEVWSLRGKQIAIHSIFGIVGDGDTFAEVLDVVKKAGISEDEVVFDWVPK